MRLFYKSTVAAAATDCKNQFLEDEPGVSGEEVPVLTGDSASVDATDKGTSVASLSRLLQVC